MKNSEMNESFNLLKTEIMSAARQDIDLPSDFCDCSVQLPVVPVRNQKQTGRCWIEAGLGDIEYRVFQRTGQLPPPLSSEYLAYHDLRWKIHLFLQRIVNTREYSIDSPLLAYWLKKPIQDAGQWAAFRKLVSCYGVIPSEYMQDSVNHIDTHALISGLCQKLRYCASMLRRSTNYSPNEAEKEVYELLDRCLGIPPKCFFYDGREFTPREFYNKMIFPYLTEDNVSFICMPTEERPFFTDYKVKWLYSDTELDSCVHYYNIPRSLFCRMAEEQLCRGMPVWIGADAAHFTDKDRGIFDIKLYNFESLLKTSLNLSSGESALYHDSAMTHAMLLWGFEKKMDGTGYMCVRNSFGADIGQNGYAYMSYEWFERYVYQIVIQKDIARQFIGDSLINNSPSVMLEPWDVIGCLAGKDFIL